MKIFTFALLLTLLAGCAGTSGTHVYRAIDSNNVEKEYAISGKYDFASTTLTIYINDKQALTGQLPLMASAGVVEGVYDGMKIKADCKYVMVLFSFGGSHESCKVYINDKLEMVLKIDQPGA